MTASDNPFQPAIEELEKELTEAERNANALLSTINLLRSKAGLPPRLPGAGRAADSEGGDAGATLSSIRPDTFYGKKMGTAAREYLEMRKSQNLGPAKPKEIYLTLVAGGFQFETKDETVAIISLRAMLRKNTVMFHKLPNGAYGLKSWYPNARSARVAEDAVSENSEPNKKETAATKKTAAAS